MLQDSFAEESALHSYAFGFDWLVRHNSLSWDDILNHQLVVVLGEPGSGKTYEMQEQATRSSPNCPRFYFRLDELAASGAHFEMSDEEARRLAHWKASENRAIFLLDSVDEAKIQQASDFHRALDRFIDLIGRPATARANIIISSRITEWLPTGDGHALRSRFPIQGKKPSGRKEERGSQEEYPFLVNLLPLDRESVTTYVNARGVAYAEKFLDALESAHAWELARRPADVNDLIAFWRDTGDLGTLTEILGFVCESQLKKTSDRERSELLALDRARSGAECLAAATILCRKFTFQIPGEMNPSANAIDGLACLSPDWRTEEVRALLTHALFDGASYGHIRFHHRRLSEFLAARWFEGLMARGCPLGELEDMLFDARGSEPVLRPSLAPLAAWLCAGANRWNMAVCRRVLENTPEILLRYGDAARLTIEDRRALLKALLRKADGRKNLWWEHDEATLSRLAHPALAPEVIGLLTASSSGRTLRELGLDLVIAGRLTDCASTVLTLAIADLVSGEIFPSAARALKVIGSESDLCGLGEAAEKAPHLPERVCVPLCELLFPKIWTVAVLFRALSRMKPASHSGIGWDYTLTGHLAAATNEGNGLALIKGFLGYPLEDDAEDEDYEAPWSVRNALAVCDVMLDWERLSGAEAYAIAEVLVRAGDRTAYSSREDKLPERTYRHPNVRESYFRLAADRLSKKYGETSFHLSSVTIFNRRLPLVSADLKWILRSFETATSDEERKTSLSWAFEVWQQTGRSQADLELMKRAAKPYSGTRRLIWRYLNPGLVTLVKGFWHRRVRQYFYRYRWVMVWREIRQPFLKLRATWLLWRYRSKLRSGENVVWLANLTSEACGESRRQWAPSDWSLLEKARGKKCAAAVKEGCKRVWKGHKPRLPHEKEPNEGTAYRTIAGLAGIMTAWQEETLSFAELSFDDARLATRYALSELNGFPPWFADLTLAQPDAVLSTLTECISGEWDISEDSENHHLVLCDLSWSRSIAGDLIKSVLMKRLAESEPKNSHVLQHALCVLVASPCPQLVEFAVLAERRSIAVPVSAPSFSQWMALWLQADAIPAIDALELRLAPAPDSALAMISICAHLSSRSGHRLPLLANPSWLTPAAMRRFIPLVYRYIRQEDDIDRTGSGGYSPTARDDAQQFRGGLLEGLVATLHPDVCVVLQELLSEPLLAHHSDYIQHLLEKHREQLADGRPWRASDVRMFATEYERDPQTDADLFRIGLRRLSDLRQWIETGEDSPRDEVHPSDNEAGFRNWLRRKLNDTARGRYVIPPEWEIDGGRPDLRLVIPGSPPVSLELKIAERWTLPELLDGLEKQLVGTYLRDDRARYGIYVLALFNPERTWDPLTDEPRIDCDQMLAILRTRMEEILVSRTDIEGLEIVLIRFSSPSH